jgi:hypothetical protein
MGVAEIHLIKVTGRCDDIRRRPRGVEAGTNATPTSSGRGVDRFIDSSLCWV